MPIMAILINSSEWNMLVFSAMQLFGIFTLLTIFGVILGFWELLRPVDNRASTTGRKWNLPPGPRGLPIAGNLFAYMKGESTAHALAKYGEMTTTHLGSKLWVVLNSDRVVTELYNRKGSVTNGRPSYPVVSKLISRSLRSVLLPTAEWSERRRVMHQLLSGSAVARYTQYQHEESLRLLDGYKHSADLWWSHHQHYSNSLIHRITFGERPSKNDADLAAVTKAQNMFLMNAPPFNLIDCFPELEKLPRVLQWWRKTYEAFGQFTLDAYSAYWTPIREEIEAGRAPPSFARDVLLGEAKFAGNQESQMFLACQLIEAGSDTTRLSLNIFVLAAALNRVKFLKARAEIDSVCGADAERLPSFEDEVRMPYVNAFAKELLRWRQIFLWTPEHTLTEDFSFEGYHFPKGTNFVINHTSISTNPDTYPEPDTFRPERWLDGHESDILRGIWQFGGGRRVCVGYKLAQKSLFINIARLVYCYDYKTTREFDTHELNHFRPGAPFPILPSLRSKKHGELITRECGDLGSMETLEKV